MSDTTSARLEPTVTRPDLVPPATVATGPVPAGALIERPNLDRPSLDREPNRSSLDRTNLDQLSRIEEKTARIEEKFARSEALLLRVEATFEESVSHFGGLARQAEVAAIDARVRGIPGYGALLFVGLLSALIGAALALAALKYGIPGFLQPVLSAPPVTPAP